MFLSTLSYRCARIFQSAWWRGWRNYFAGRKLNCVREPISGGGCRKEGVKGCASGDSLHHIQIRLRDGDDVTMVSVTRFIQSDQEVFLAGLPLPKLRRVLAEGDFTGAVKLRPKICVAAHKFTLLLSSAGVALAQFLAQPQRQFRCELVMA